MLLEGVELSLDAAILGLRCIGSRLSCCLGAHRLIAGNAGRCRGCQQFEHLGLAGGRLHAGDETGFQQLGGELGQHLDMVVGAARRGGNHEEQPGGFAIFGAVVDALAADADHDGGLSHRLALGVGQGDPLLEAGVVQRLPRPEVADKLILTGYLAAGLEPDGQFDKQRLLVAGRKIEADQSFIYQGGEHGSLLAGAVRMEVVLLKLWCNGLTCLLFLPSASAEIGHMCPLLDFCVDGSCL